MSKQLRVVIIRVQLFRAMKNANLKIPGTSFTLPKVLFSRVLELSKLIFINETIPKYLLVSEYVKFDIPHEPLLYIGTMMWKC